MLETEAKTILSDYFDRNNFLFEKEARLSGCVIDFLLDKEGKKIGVEVKGSYSETNSALGQILNYFNFLSHMYLAAPKDFMKKFQKDFGRNPETTDIMTKLGFLVIGEQGVTELKPPQNESYYFVQPPKEKKTNSVFHTNEPILDEIDMTILNTALLKGVVMVSELKTEGKNIFNAEKINIERIRKRLDGLCKFGFLSKINTHPRAYIPNKEKIQKIDPNSVWRSQ